MSEETTPLPTAPVVDAVVAPAPTPAPVAPPPAAPSFDPRRRLRELLSVPERDRSDAQWDEIVELEIQLAPGNRVHPNSNPDAPLPTGGKPSPGGKKHHRPNKNSGGGGGGGGGNRRPQKPKANPGS